MSDSFNIAIDRITEALEIHVLPSLSEDFAKGQLFAVLFSLKLLRMQADWAPDFLREQMAIQDKAFDRIRTMVDALQGPVVPASSSSTTAASSSDLERLRNAGDEAIGELLKWAMLGGPETEAQRREIETILRLAVRDQLKVEIARTPPSMLTQIATGRVG